MRIVFDGTTLRPYQTGVGYYTEHLLHHLAREVPGHEIVVVSNRPVETSHPLPPHVRIPSAGRFPIRGLWIQCIAPLIVRSQKGQLAHFTNSVAPLAATTTPTVVTIHDMTLQMFPHWHPWHRRVMRPLVQLSARRAEAVIAVSRSSRRDILAGTGLAPERVRAIYEAPAPVFQPLSDTSLQEVVRRRYGLSCRIILCVGTIEPRKNLLRLIEAFRRARKREPLPHQLVLAGMAGWGYGEVKRRIEQLGLQKDVLLLGYVPFSLLPALYNLAEIFVFPSLYEGFGLPVLEAMACGVPVVAGRNSSLPEVGGEAVELVDVSCLGAIQDALLRLTSDPDRRRDLSKRGFKWVRSFSWRRAARETLEVYRSVGAV